ncbi:HD domain-containing protein [bacterium]|nr:HD domain-containing protein [bacterium]
MKKTTRAPRERKQNGSLPFHRRETILFVRPDAHGVAMGAITFRQLLAAKERVDVVCSEEQTGNPKSFWRDTFLALQVDPGRTRRIIILETPLPSSDQGLVEQVQAKVKALTRTGTLVEIIDHHRGTKINWAPLVEAGAKVVIVSNPALCFTGAWGSNGQVDKHARRWGRIGAICDRDNYHRDAKSSEVRIAHGLDVVVREAPLNALVCIANDTRRRDKDAWKWLLGLAETNPLPDIVKQSAIEVVAGEYRVLICQEPLYSNWGYRQLEALAEKHDCHYAIGAMQNGVTKLVVLRHWKKDAQPPRWRLSEYELRGQQDAVTLRLEEGQDQSELMREIARKLAQPIPEEAELTAKDMVSFGLGIMTRVHAPWYMTEHTQRHVIRVLKIVESLASLFFGRKGGNFKYLDDRALLLLRLAGALHDIGHGMKNKSPEDARKHHYEYSHDMILEMAKNGKFEGLLTDEEVGQLAEICLYHGGGMPFPKDLKAAFVCALLRIADGMDIDWRRANQNTAGTPFSKLEEDIIAMGDGQIEHWQGHQAIYGTRIVAHGDALTFDFVVTDLTKSGFQRERFMSKLDGVKSGEKVRSTPRADREGVSSFVRWKIFTEHVA